MKSPTDLSAQARPWFRIVLRGLLMLVIVLAAAGFIYENISEARDIRFHPMPGRLVDVGGYKLHIHCVGQGSPAVVLDSGLGDSYMSWHKIQPEIAKFTRVCSYDRAGIGYSDSSPRGRTSKDIAEELHTLLHNAAIGNPIILVGHSLGGFDIRLYTRLYPSDVASIVLVDASHPDQENRLPVALRDMEKSWLREAEFLEFAMPLGIPRILGLCDPDPAIRAAECNFHTAREGVAETKALAESAAQTAAAGPLGDLPLVVFSRDPNKPSAELPPDIAKATSDAWEKMQEELAGLSTKGTQAIATGSAHYIQFDRPDVVIDAVREIVDQARQAGPTK